MSARWLPGNRQTRLVFFDVTVVYLVDHRAASYLVLCSFRDNNMIWLYKTWIATLDAIIKRIILGRCLRGGKMKTISKAQTRVLIIVNGKCLLYCIWCINITSVRWIETKCFLNIFKESRNKPFEEKAKFLMTCWV